MSLKVIAGGKEMQTKIGVVPAREMMALRVEGRQIISAGSEIVAVATPTTYEECSEIRARAKAYKASVDAKFTPIIDPLLTALNATYALRKEVTDPILEVDKRLTGLMKEYKQEELLKERREQERRREEAEALRREAEAKRVAEAAAVTIPMRKLLGSAAVALEDKAEVIEAAPAPLRVRATSSGSRIVRKWRVPDFPALLAAIVRGDVPVDVVSINVVSLNDYFRHDPAAVAAFPGVEVYEDVSIFNR